MLVTTLAACIQPVGPTAATDTGPGPAAEFTVDIRIDAADPVSDADSFGTRLCVAEDRAVYVLWMDDRAAPGVRNGLWLNRSLDGGDTWLVEAVRVDDDAGDVYNPAVACDATGASVVWEDDRDGDLENHQIYADRWPSGAGGFGVDVLVEADPDGLSMSLEPQIVARGDALTVAWYDNVNGAYDIFVTTSDDGGATWRDPTRADSDAPAGAAYSARPKLAVGDLGETWVLFEDARDGKIDVRATRGDSPPMVFDEDQRLDGGDAAGASDAYEPQLCAGDGWLYAVWHDARNSDEHRDIYLNASSDGGRTWLPEAVRLDTDAPGDANSLFPACLADGSDLTVAWMDDREGVYDLWVRDVHAGVPGDPEVRLDLGDGNSLDARIAGDDGTVVVAWRDGRNDVDEENGYDDLFYDFREPGGSFTDGDLRIDSMYDGQSYKLDVQIAVLDRELFTAWTDGRGGTSDVYFQRLEIGSASNPPEIEAR